MPDELATVGYGRYNIADGRHGMKKEIMSSKIFVYYCSTLPWNTHPWAHTICTRADINILGKQ